MDLTYTFPLGWFPGAGRETPKKRERAHCADEANMGLLLLTFKSKLIFRYNLKALRIGETK